LHEKCRIKYINVWNTYSERMTTGYLKIALKNTHTQGTQKSGTAKENMD
jgi:hypothetical protein